MKRIAVTQAQINAIAKATIKAGKLDKMALREYVQDTKADQRRDKAIRLTPRQRVQDAAEFASNEVDTDKLVRMVDDAIYALLHASLKRTFLKK